MTQLDSSMALIAQARALVVSSPPTRQDAANLWGLLRGARKDAEAQKEAECRPLKDAWEQAKAPFDTFIKDCVVHEATLQHAMSAWDAQQDALAKAEQARLQAITDKANAKIIEKAEAKGIEPILKVAPVVVAVPKSVETVDGSTQTRSEKKVYGVKGMELQGDARADNPLVAQLLKDYPALFVLDRVRFNALAKTGMLDNRNDVEVRIEFIYARRS